MTKINDEQKRILKSFKCERLSSNDKNSDLIKRFKNEKGEPLVEYLQDNAWEDDEIDRTAFYLIKDPEDDVLLFFSLKCGSLFDPLNEEEIANNVNEEVTRILKNTPSDMLPQLVEQIRLGTNLELEIKKVRKKFEILTSIEKDKEYERNGNILRVISTYPGIELVHFCSNSLYKNKWKNIGINHSMGEVMFWEYITPIIFDIQKLVGCQYMFLFAADLTEDETLINYYNVSLKFTRPDDIGTNKPLYDFMCQFMCQDINDMKKHRQNYFDNFNISGDILA